MYLLVILFCNYLDDPDEPEVYTRGKAVLRVYNRVAGTLGTAWLVGDEGHILTNWHVIETQAEAEGAEFQAMAESSTCQPKCEIQLGKYFSTLGPLDLQRNRIQCQILKDGVKQSSRIAV